MADVDDNDTLLAAEIVRHGRRHQSASIKAFVFVAVQTANFWLHNESNFLVILKSVQTNHPKKESPNH
jgi:hypothetical protein